jgi:hypothetical protein
MRPTKLDEHGRVSDYRGRGQVAPRDEHGGNPQEDLHSPHILRYSPKSLEEEFSEADLQEL